ncbi:acyl-CoA synthetase, partial [Nocardia zapadnayensis]|nr:acyl-CoA synthetase [Nocardia zapadnayensis]
HPTFAEQFAHLAESRGDVTALIDATGELTFAELEARTNQVARLFEEHGVGQGDFVLISTAVGSVTMV